MDPYTLIGDQNTEQLLQAAYKPDPVPAEFAARLQKQLLESAQTLARSQPAPKTPTRPRPTAAYLVAALAACILVAFGFWVWQRTPPNVLPKSHVDIDLPQAQFTRWSDDLSAGLMPRKRPAGPALGTLKEGQTLTTKAGQRRLVQLADGTRLFVNEKSRVEAGPDRQIVLHQGQIYLEVAPLQDGPRFVVKSADRVITATGTHFAVQAEGAGAGVIVTQGKVKVEGLAEEITAGQRIVPGTSTVSSAPRASHALQWTRDLMAAAETPMVPGAEHAGGALLALDPQGQEIKLNLRKYHVDVHLEDGFARTTIDQTYFNTTWERLEGTFYFPLPPDASLSRLAMYVADGNNQCKLMEGGMAEKKHAANVYETIRYQRRDPALLEWLDGSTFKMRVFPLEAKQEKRIILSYTQKLPTLYGVTRYRFPGGHNMPVVRDWSFQARVKPGANLSMWSPSHADMIWLPDNGDMIGKIEARNGKPGEDVLLELQERIVPVDHDQPHFSSLQHENNTYLMLRYRPTLPSLPQRERRDWIVLFEASAQRDPLLAGTQADILKELLRNAEYDDTFTLLTANSSVRIYNDQPLPARPKQVADALKFLHESTHLVGALDLEQGLQAALKFAKDAKNPHLLHLGSGTPAMGERDAGTLARLVPPSVRYVGVGVGKRWNRAFMKSAAERTGGLFAQINPDEVIAWRAFDLLATLNTPRLLDVQVAGNSEKTPFLSETTMLAQGEELCAITRIEPNKNVFPGKVTVKGMLDGKPIVREFPVINVVAGAGHMPRTWAKYEIDRLLAADAEKHRAEVVTLSKSMYVMSPFTSLLVLETDADYEKYKVDRGRKDHWAMYPCPAKIPLVYEPNGAAPVKKEDVKKQPGQKPTCEEVLKTILMGSSFLMAERCTDSSCSVVVYLDPERLRALNVSRAEVIKALDKATTTARSGNVPITDQMPIVSINSIVVGPNDLGNIPIKPEQRVYLRDLIYPQGTGNLILGVGVNSDSGLVGSILQKDRIIRRTTELYPGQILQYPDLRIAGETWLDRSAWSKGRMKTDPSDIQVERMRPQTLFIRQSDVIDDFKRPREISGRGLVDTDGSIIGGPNAFIGSSKRMNPVDWVQYYKNHGYQINSGVTGGGSARVQCAPVFVSPQMQWAVPGSTLASAGGSGFVSSGPSSTIPTSANPFASSYSNPFSLGLAANYYPNSSGGFGAPNSTSPTFGVATIYTSNSNSTTSFEYKRPEFAYDRTMFTNLLQYAPGLHNSQADLLATLEQEADLEARKLGNIDPDARKLIDRARSTDWFSLAVPAYDPLPGYKIAYNGIGQFAYERILDSGLGEKVVCDGKTLWHLYPEIGLAAKRPFSRHHQDVLSSFAPAFLPPAEELARGFEVRAIDGSTVALVPFGADKLKEQKYVRLHLVFGNDGRLRERQVVEMPAGSPLLRQVFLADGSLEWRDGKDKVLAKQTLNVAPAQAPNLEPGVRELVVMTMPIRTSEHINEQAKKRGLDPATSPDVVMQRLVSRCCTASTGTFGFAEAIADYTLTHANGNHRLGLLTLLNAAGIPAGGLDPGGYYKPLDIAKEHPQNPLAKFLTKAQRELVTKIQPELLSDMPEHGFIARLSRFRNLWITWDQQLATRGKKLPIAKAQTLKFLQETNSPIFAYAVIDAMMRKSNTAPTDHMMSVVVNRLGPLSDPLGLGYVFRYEYARSLYHAGKGQEAVKLFKDLHAQTLAYGVLPPIEGDFRTVLQMPSPGAGFVPFVRQTLGEFLAKKRYGLAFQLARQVDKLGDDTLCDEMLATILDKAPAEERPLLTLASIHVQLGRNRFAQADRLLQKLLEDKKLAENASLWRWRRDLTQKLGQPSASIACLEKALDLEYADLPEVVNLGGLRTDYRTLLGHYLKMAEALVLVEKETPSSFLAKVIRVADRWRLLDAESAEPCQLAGKIFQTLGKKELAWDYWTTPIDLHPSESKAWLDLAGTMQTEGDLDKADRAFALAFQTEPTNPEILWQRAHNLVRLGQAEPARQLYRQIASGQWQERFNATVEQARNLATP